MQIFLLTSSGERVELDVHPGPTLMEFLRDYEDGLAARCGGRLDCGSCHVYLLTSHQVEPPSPEELELLVGLESRKENSRLACQVRVTRALDGLGAEIAPED